MLLVKVKLLCAFLALPTLASPFIPQRGLEGLPRTELKRPSYGNEYLREVIKVLLHERNRLEGEYEKYRRNVRAMDLTMLLLGTYSKAWHSGAEGEAQRLQETAYEELKKGRIKRRADEDLLRGNTQDHSNSLGVLYMASVSYGHVASPHEMQSANVDATKRPQYAFRLSQQALRNAVIREHAERLLELKQEIAFLRKQVDLYCKNQSEDAILLWDVKPSDFNPRGMPSRTGVSCAPCELNALALEVQLAIRQGLAYLSQQNSALGHRLCLLYMVELTQAKALAQKIELKIADLAVQYAKLNNMEKDKDR